MGEETLLIVSLALCFGMVVMAANTGFSAAFGCLLYTSIKKGIVTNKTKMSVKLARSGGFALSLIEAAPSDRKSIKKWK